MSDAAGGAAGLIAAPPPRVAPQQIGVLRSALATAGFTGPGVRDALRTGSGPTATTLDAPVYDRRLAAVAPLLAALVRLFVLNVELPLDRAEADLQPLDAELLRTLGLAAERDGRLAPCLRLVPHDELVIASDLSTTVQRDHVASVHRPSATLSSLTVRRPVARALDLGTGNGIQALRAAAHCGHVVATDVNERALAFAEFNAALNGVTNVELRAGSFFEPVRGERFDLVVANPPYVISPETALVFRDSGKPGDSVSAELVAALPDHLVDGGFATIMVSWAAGADTVARPRGWVDGRGCDAWLIHTAAEDARTSAATWNRAAGTDPDGFAARVDEWVAYYEKLGIERIAYGALVLRRRDGADTWFRAAELPEERLQPASSQLERMFAAPDLAVDVLDVPLALVESAFLDRTARVEDGGWHEVSAAVRLESGIGFGVNLDPFGARLVVLFDGRAPLRPQLPGLARELGVPEPQLEAFATRLATHLLEHGLVAAP